MSYEYPDGLNGFMFSSTLQQVFICHPNVIQIWNDYGKRIVELFQFL